MIVNGRNNYNILNFSDKIPVYVSLFFHPDGATCLAVLYYLHYVFYYKLTTPLFLQQQQQRERRELARRLQ